MSGYVYQEQDFDCGYACICTLLNLGGRDLLPGDLREKYGHCARELSVPRLLEIMGDQGVSAEACRVDVDDLRTADGPLILHWRLNHFVVYLGRLGNRFRIFDPAEGERTISAHELGEGFSGIAIQAIGSDVRGHVSQSQGSRRPGSFRIIQRLLAVKEAPAGLVALVAISLVSQIAFLLSPAYVALVVDKALFDLDESDLVLAASLFAGVVAFQVASSWVRSLSLATLSANLNHGWYREAVSRLVRLAPQYFDSEPVGETVTRVASIRAVQSVLTLHGAELIVDLIAVLLCGVMLLLIAPQILFVGLFAVGLYAAVKAINVGPMVFLTTQAIRNGASLTSGMVETVRAGRYLKALGMVDVREAELGARLSRMVNSEYSMARRIAFLNSSSQLIFGIEKVLSIGLAGYFAASGRIGVGALFAVVLYREQLGLRGGALVDRAFELRVLSSHTRRLEPIYQIQNQAGTSDWVHNVRNLECGQIEIDVDYGYPGADSPVLEGCAIKVAAGETVAIVGPSGCGKSTLSKIVCGIARPSRGQVRIGRRADGGPAKVVAVFQDEVFFGGSLLDNLAGFAKSINMERVREACEISECTAFIEALPAGFYTHIADGGYTLSAGQRQRIALARAIYADPDLLVMDEATSALDVASEQRIGKRLAQLGCTKIIIAHRPETIGTADRVLEMRSGKIEFERAPSCWRIPSQMLSGTVPDAVKVQP